MDIMLIALISLAIFFGGGLVLSELWNFKKEWILMPTILGLVMCLLLSWWLQAFKH